jgi:2-phospho-L-lactate/phosphoenolpyruvate guanylyltransferase
MKSLAIVIPVKPPEQGKSRLSSVLLPQDRLALNRALLRHTFEQAAKLADFASIYVVSKSAEVAADASKRGFVACDEPETCELNGAIRIGADAALRAGLREVMVLPVDLPGVSSKRLIELVEEFRRGFDVLIVADRAGSGTNVLLWRPIDAAVFCYGSDSAQRHARSAEALGLRLAKCQDTALSFDIDTPTDLQLWMQKGRLLRLAGVEN